MEGLGLGGGRQLPVQWTVTLGDLLTLLLCFFVVTFSTVKRGVPEKNQAVAAPKAPGESRSEGRAEVLGDQHIMPGTVLAYQQVDAPPSPTQEDVRGQLPPAVALLKDDLQSEELGPQAQEKLERLLGIGGIKVVSVAACSTDSSSRMRAWEESAQTGHLLARAIQEIRPGIGMELRIAGTNCEALGAKSFDTEEMVALVVGHQRGIEPHG